MSSFTFTLPPILLLDGGLGTTLADDFSCTFDDSTPLWSSQLLLTSPTTLLAAQTSFAQAGADVILTATYQASHEGFLASGIQAQDAESAMRSAVRLARQAFEGKEGKVALSLGAYGAVMIPSQEYSGAYDENHRTVRELRDWHGKRLDVFSKDVETWSEVDLVAFETLPLLAEIHAVRDVMGGKSADGEREFWITCVFPGEGLLLPDGSTVEEVVKAMLGKRESAKVPMGVGINCTKVGKVEELVGKFEKCIAVLVENGEVAGWPSLALYPDGTNGEVYNTTTKEWEKKEDGKSTVSWDETLLDIVSRAQERRRWKSILVGGCCKTAPKDIANLRKRIDQVQPK